MYPKATHLHSIFCILPPYILRAMAQNGTPQQRATALQVLATDSTFRASRAGQRLAAPLAQRRPSVLMEEGRKQRTIYDARNIRTLPGDVKRVEGAPPTGDPAVDEMKLTTA